MSKLFGIPMTGLAVGLVVVLAVVLGLVGALALRNLVFLKLGIRNVGRRRARTILIVVGLMLGTAIVASSLATGDTVGLAIRSSALQSLGRIDEAVTVRGAQVTGSSQVLGGAQVGEAEQPRYVDVEVAARVERAVAGSGLVDGVMPAIVQPVAVQNVTAKRSEPRVTLFAPDPARLAGFGTMQAADGAPAALSALRPGEAYVNAEAAEKLAAAPGDRLLVYALGRAEPVTVRAVVRYDGAGTDGAAVLMPLSSGQALLGAPGKASAILVSNTGGETSGVARSAAVKQLLDPVVAPLGLETQELKSDALDTADAAGSVFMSIFTTFGSFSIAAGILLIFLIFVMLAAERRSELGVARAIGTRRGHLVQMFVYEGVAYDLVSAAVGALLGVAIAWLMVWALGAFLRETGLEVGFSVQGRSILVAYALGVLLTFVVVAFSAWRVSRLNIVSAVRNLPEPTVKKSRRRHGVSVVVLLALGALLIQSGRSSGNGTAFALGVSATIAGIALLLRALGAPERAAFTVAGVALVAWWLMPFHVGETLAGTKFRMDFSIFIVAGLVIVVGAAWIVIYNADVLVSAIMAVLGRVRALAPIVKMAMAYPLRSRFRTGITLAMFTLVVFTLVVGAITSGSFISAFDNLGSFGGGFGVRASAAPTSPVADMGAAVRGSPALRQDVTAVASQSYVPVDARQVGTARKFESYPLRGLDDAFLRTTTFGLAATARGYPTAADVWRALRTRPGLAVVDSFTAPRRSNFNFGPPQHFRLSGFYLEDGTFAPVPVDVRDPASGRTVRLTVIGILRDDAPQAMIGISTSEATAVAAFGARARPSVYYFALRPGADAKAVAARLESRFLVNGLEAQALSEVLDDAVGASLTINRLIQAFMGLGLVVGVAALGVISARSVVERRQQIGVLRAIGFRRGMVQLSFLFESSLIALTAIVAGTVLGLVVAYNVIADSASSQNYANVHMVVPWLNLAIVFVVVYVVALAATFAAGRRAARVYPAQALRYE